MGKNDVLKIIFSKYELKLWFVVYKFYIRVKLFYSDIVFWKL